MITWNAWDEANGSFPEGQCTEEIFEYVVKHHPDNLFILTY